MLWLGVNLKQLQIILVINKLINELK